MIEPDTAGTIPESLDNIQTRFLGFRRDSWAATSNWLVCPPFFLCVPIFLFSKSHLSVFFFHLSWMNLVKLKLYKVICLDVFIKLPRDICVLHHPFIAKVFARSPCDQTGKTVPICRAALCSLSSLKAGEKPVTSAVFTNQALGCVMWFPLRWGDCVLWRDGACNITRNIKSTMSFLDDE